MSHIKIEIDSHDVDAQLIFGQALVDLANAKQQKIAQFAQTMEDRKEIVEHVHSDPIETTVGDVELSHENIEELKHKIEVAVTPQIVPDDVVIPPIPHKDGECPDDLTSEQTEFIDDVELEPSNITVLPPTDVELTPPQPTQIWDDRIHSSSKSLNQDGTYKYRRKPTDMTDEEWNAFKLEVEAELSGLAPTKHSFQDLMKLVAPQMLVPDFMPRAKEVLVSYGLENLTDLRLKTQFIDQFINDMGLNQNV